MLQSPTNLRLYSIQCKQKRFQLRFDSLFYYMKQKMVFETILGLGFAAEPKVYTFALFCTDRRGWMDG